MADLIIIEAPGKLKRFYELLESIQHTATVIATLGHLYDNPPSFEVPAIRREQGGFIEPLRRPVRDDVLRRLSLEISQCQGRILVATDVDREGHVIADDIHALVTSLNVDRPLYRLSLHSLTPTALRQALDQLSPLNAALAAPGHARRISDRLITEHYSDFAAYRPVGRVSTAMLSMIEQGIPTGVVKLTLPAETGPVFEADATIPVGMTPAQMIAELREVDYLEPSHRVWETLTEAPDNTDVTLGLSQVLNMSLMDATQLMQQLYESGKISYHRTSSHGYHVDSHEHLQKWALAKGVLAFKKAQLPLEESDGHEAIRILLEPEQIDINKPYALQKTVQDAALSYIARTNLLSGIPIEREYANTDTLPEWARELTFTRSRKIAVPWTTPSVQSITLTDEQALFRFAAEMGIGTPATRALHVAKLLQSSKVQGLTLSAKGQAVLEQAPQVLRDLETSQLLENMFSLGAGQDVDSLVENALLFIERGDHMALNELLDALDGDAPTNRYIP